MTVIVSLTPATMLALGVGGALCLGVYEAGRSRLLRRLPTPSRAPGDVAQEMSSFGDAIPGMLFTILRDRAGHDSMPYVSRGIVDLFGPTPADVARSLKPLDRVIEARDLPRLLRAFDESVSDPAAGRIEYRISHPVKGPRWIVTYCRGHQLADGSKVWHGYSYDITEQKRAEHRRARDYYALVESSPDVIVRYDNQCRRVYVNLAHTRASGMAPAVWLGRTPIEISAFNSDSAVRYQQRLWRILEAGADDEIEVSTQSPEGGMKHYSVRATPEFDLDGSISGVLTMARDVTQRVLAEEQLHQREQLFRTLVEHSPDFIARYDRACQIIYANPAMMREIRTMNAAELTKVLIAVTDAQPNFLECLRVALEMGTDQQGEFRFELAEGTARWVAVRFVVECDEAGGAQSVLAIGRDVTGMVRYREKVRQLALYDSLTGLPNRTLLYERLEDALCGAGSARRQVGLMLLDLDNFKDVNDVLGHAGGDRLLAEVSKRIARSLSPADTVARLGGDEFAIVVSFSEQDFDLAFAASRVLVALSGPAHIDGREVFASASIGVARYPKDGTDAAELLRYADAAMYVAKQSGGNRFCFHDAAAARAAVERLELGQALRAAREQGELALLFQPIVALPDGWLIGAEALLRWDHPSRGRLTPDQFIGVAEANGTIVDIGAWVLLEACHCAARWNALASVPLRVSVNISARQFVMNDVAQTVREALVATGCAPHWLAIEITESLLLEDSYQVRCTLDELSRMGVALAIDDFGTGYSSMSYLGKFPIDMLKIDRSFVRNVDTDAKMRALVKAIVSVAGALSLDVVAEGIETRAQAETLAELGCGKAQGYLFGRPMPGASFDKSLELAHSDFS